jgi:hypothetical protein
MPLGEWFICIALPYTTGMMTGLAIALLSRKNNAPTR